ncbi:fch and double sh3 domains protein [Anaeramoeba flamelloides]|uniref:Fch and double sh3 domains protein n=1 Tax=Anaeramoeba flamelloides TaxID=1746091 RepID=A0ABQ8XE38_9EUKA|nr:fch and double sh3 domains protein [Anaeramoeba flamelloides]
MMEYEEDEYTIFIEDHEGDPKCYGLQPYTKQKNTELSFDEGELIFITGKNESGWWQGETVDDFGIFHVSMVKLAEEEESTTNLDYLSDISGINFTKENVVPINLPNKNNNNNKNKNNGFTEIKSVEENMKAKKPKKERVEVLEKMEDEYLGDEDYDHEGDQRARALCDYYGEKENDIFFKKGEIIYVYGNSGEGKVQAENSQKFFGDVPVSFLEFVDDNGSVTENPFEEQKPIIDFSEEVSMGYIPVRRDLSKRQDIISNSNVNNYQDSQQQVEEEYPYDPDEDHEDDIKAIALCDYTAKKQGELSFKKGQIIYITGTNESGWWQGETRDFYIGNLDSTMIEIIDQENEKENSLSDISGIEKTFGLSDKKNENGFNENEYNEYNENNEQNEYNENENHENEFDENEYNENEYNEKGSYEYNENEFNENDYNENKFNENEYYEENEYNENVKNENESNGEKEQNENIENENENQQGSNNQNNNNDEKENEGFLPPKLPKRNNINGSDKDENSSTVKRTNTPTLLLRKTRNFKTNNNNSTTFGNINNLNSKMLPKIPQRGGWSQKKTVNQKINNIISENKNKNENESSETQTNPWRDPLRKTKITPKTNDKLKTNNSPNIPNKDTEKVNKKNQKFQNNQKSTQPISSRGRGVQKGWISKTPTKTKPNTPNSSKMQPKTFNFRGGWPQKNKLNNKITNVKHENENKNEKGFSETQTNPWRNTLRKTKITPKIYTTPKTNIQPKPNHTHNTKFTSKYNNTHNANNQPKSNNSSNIPNRDHGQGKTKNQNFQKNQKSAQSISSRGCLTRSNTINNKNSHINNNKPNKENESSEAKINPWRNTLRKTKITPKTNGKLKTNNSPKIPKHDIEKVSKKNQKFQKNQKSTQPISSRGRGVQKGWISKTPTKTKTTTPSSSKIQPKIPNHDLGKGKTKNQNFPTNQKSTQPISSRGGWPQRKNLNQKSTNNVVKQQWKINKVHTKPPPNLKSHQTGKNSIQMETKSVVTKGRGGRGIIRGRGAVKGRGTVNGRSTVRGKGTIIGRGTERGRGINMVKSFPKPIQNFNREKSKTLQKNQKAGWVKRTETTKNQNNQAKNIKNEEEFGTVSDMRLKFQNNNTQNTTKQKTQRGNSFNQGITNSQTQNQKKTPTRDGFKVNRNNSFTQPNRNFFKKKGDQSCNVGNRWGKKQTPPNRGGRGTGKEPFTKYLTSVNNLRESNHRNIALTNNPRKKQGFYN